MTIRSVLLTTIGCFLLVELSTTGVAFQYHVREKPLTDITAPQPAAQVVSPAIYEQLGGQERALKDVEGRFATIDQKIKDIDTSISRLVAEIKPLEDASLEVHLIINVMKGVFGIALTTGLFSFLVHYLREHWVIKTNAVSGKETDLRGITGVPGVMSSVFGSEAGSMKTTEQQDHPYPKEDS